MIIKLNFMLIRKIRRWRQGRRRRMRGWKTFSHSTNCFLFSDISRNNCRCFFVGGWVQRSPHFWLLLRIIKVVIILLNIIHSSSLIFMEIWMGQRFEENSLSNYSPWKNIFIEIFCTCLDESKGTLTKWDAKFALCKSNTIMGWYQIAIVNLSILSFGAIVEVKFELLIENNRSDKFGEKNSCTRTMLTSGWFMIKVSRITLSNFAHH